MAGTPIPQYGQYDFALIPLLNLVVEPVAGDVTATAENTGRIYRNTSTGRLRYCRGVSGSVNLDIAGLIANGDIAADAAIALSKLAVDVLARVNHTGTQLAATISDLAATVKAYRLDEFAAPTADIDFNGQKIVDLADGEDPGDAATYGQLVAALAAMVSGQDWKASARVAATANVTVAAPGANVDGVAMSAGQSAVLAGQTAQAENGVWVWNGAAVPMTRRSDADADAEVTAGMTVPIEEGTQGNKLALLTTDNPIVVGTTALAFTFIAVGTVYVQGTGITITGNTISLTSPVTVALGGTGATDAAGARSNLGVPKAGFHANIGALTAGVPLDIAHGLGSEHGTVQVFRNSDDALVGIGIQFDDTNVTITADVDVAANVLRVEVIPAVS